MSNAGWVAVVESGELWTASLRVALRRQAAHGPQPTIVRVTSVDVRALDHTTPVFLAVELHQERAAETLALLAALRSAPVVATAALLPRMQQADAAELGLAALEAGACLAVASPREVHRVAGVATRWLAATHRDLGCRQSLLQHALDGLPWQPAPSGLG